MVRLERPGQIAYRDRRLGWSLLFLCVVFPVALLLFEEALRRRETAMTFGTGGATLAAIATAFALMRTNTLVIDPAAGTVVSSRARFVWTRQQTCNLAEVRAVLLGTKIVDHATLRGRNDWSETVYQIMIEVGPSRMPVHEGIIGPSGKTLANLLAKDLGVPVRNEF